MGTETIFTQRFASQAEAEAAAQSAGAGWVAIRAIRIAERKRGLWQLAKEC